jgi:hypothetical protein
VCDLLLYFFQCRLGFGKMAAAGFFENGHGFLDVLQSVGVALFLQPDFANQMERDARLNSAAIGAAERKALCA